MSVNIVLGFFIFIIGLCIGSFLNVVILRGLSEESIVYPPSKCPKCQSPLKWWHNIPILSYILLKGKCGFCHEKISIQYPIIEFITGYLFLSAFLKFGFTVNLFFILVFISMLIVISTTDIKEHVAFNLHSYILGGFGIIYNFFNFGNLYQGHTWIFNTSFIASILGILVGAGIITLIFGFGYLTLRTMIIGIGDIFIAGALGACFGWKHVLYILGGAFLIQVLTCLPALLIKFFKKQDFITFASFIIFIFTTLADLIFVIYFNNANTVFIRWILYLILVLSGILLAIRLIQSLPKNLAEINEKMIEDSLNGNLPQNNEISHMPFGPALCLASLIFLFIFC